MYLFTYGTLQDRHIQHKLLNRTLIGVSDTISGFLKFEWGDGEGVYPVITPVHGMEDDEGVINGTTYEITEEDIYPLDAYETMAYKRIWVKTAKGFIAQVYVQN